jgi:hypothetical protein
VWFDLMDIGVVVLVHLLLGTCTCTCVLMPALRDAHSRVYVRTCATLALCLVTGTSKRAATCVGCTPNWCQSAWCLASDAKHSLNSARMAPYYVFKRKLEHE